MSQPDNTPDGNTAANTPEKLNKFNRPDYDGAWKTSLERYFKDFLALLFPEVHNRVDWTKGYQFMNNELENITRNAATGRRYADKLVRVYYKNSGKKWLLIHVEIQGDPQADFAERMFTYSCLLHIRYRVNLENLAVFTDLNEHFRPNSLTLGGEAQGTLTTTHFTYPTAKLLDYETEQEWANLKESDNVFALVVMAQIKTKRLKSAGKDKELLLFQIALTRSLFERGYTEDKIRELFNIIDWMINLPLDLRVELKSAVDAIQEEKKMPAMNTFEILSYKEGFEEAYKEAEERFAQERQEAEARAAEKQCHSIRQLIVQGILNDTQIAEVFGVSVAYVAELRLGSKH
ncbi:MAG: hypothetical protein GX029_13625 [Pseudomonadaceae bacterium]|nr:hypothetical protein [Pseudomonadaceae bacterium]